MNILDHEHTEDSHSLPADEEMFSNALPNHSDERITEEGVTDISRSNLPTTMQLFVALLLLASVFGVSYLPWLHTKSHTPSTVEKSIRSEEKQQRAEVVVPEPKIEATSAFIWDIRHQRALFSKNASAQLPLASITKLMTSLVALESLPKGSKVAMTLDAIHQDGPSDFTDGETFDAKALSDFSLVSSSNDGAYALAAAAGATLLSKDNENSTSSFITAMNKRAEELGLTQTYFVNTTGLDENTTKSGSYGSARDMTFLMEYLIEHHPEILESTTVKMTTVRGNTLHTATNTNEIVNHIPGLLGSKTGYTDLAGGNLVIVFDAGLNRPVVVSVLGSSREGRFKDVASLIAFAQKTITVGEQP